MKNLTKYSFAFLVIVIGISVAQELNIDGDLNVTGTIESVTIDSLNQVIIDLQNQISGMQVENRLETRVFTTNSIVLSQQGVYIPFDIQSLIGTEVEHAFISVFDADIDGEEFASINLADTMNGPYEIRIDRFPQQYLPITIKNIGLITYTKEVYDTYGNYIFIWVSTPEVVNVILTLAITAQFPN